MKVLIVDDEPLVLRDMERTVKEVVSESTVIFCASDSKSAIQFAQNEDVHIAFLDIDMPDMNGVAMAKLIKELHNNVNIIFVTAYSEYMRDAWEMYASGYLLKPVRKNDVKHAIGNLRYKSECENNEGLLVKTFGNFEVFMDGEPIKFQYSKTKELFAYLIDRNGALCTNGELMAVLWEDEATDNSHVSYLKNLKADLKNSLLQIGRVDILTKQRGRIGILPNRIKCDYYEWIKNAGNTEHKYMGEYMQQYTWSEVTHARLG